MTSRRSVRLIAVAGAGAAVASLLIAAPTVAQAAQSQPSIVSANPADYTPNVLNGRVKALAQVGPWIVAGGSFSSVQAAGSTTSLTRTNLFAFNATTGAISTAFAPTIGGGLVEALAPAANGTSVYVGGAFTSVNGTTVQRVTELDLATGARTAGFAAPSISGPVRDLKVVGNRLYISGAFSKVGGVARQRMASLSAQTGALTNVLTLGFTGTANGGTTTVSKFDVSPDGSRLVAIGNFATVDGQPRSQIAMLDTSGATATLSGWDTDRYPGLNPDGSTYCAGVFNTYMRDLDFSPDGSYFVVSTTGAYGGPDSSCDTITRWQTAGSTGGQQPFWVDTTGGDTTYAVSVTGAAVYVGGHMRWLNNPYAGDAQGPGGVPREGIAALDPLTGLPYSWNPGRARGVGVFDFLPTSTGLWLGNDTSRLGGETHRRLGFFPLAGGAALPARATATLPGTVYQLGRVGAGSDPSVLYRVNAGGPQLLSVDDGPDWAADTDFTSPYRNSGSNSADWSGQPIQSVDASVPTSAFDGAPSALFNSERWDPADDNELQWSFPVPTGTHVQVRLYVANQCGCTSTPGSRVYDISLDGSVVANDLDLTQSFGDRVGHMLSYNITSDGSVDISFGHVVENPLINGIEIIDTDVPAGTASNPIADQVQSRTLSASGVPGPITTKDGTEAWSQARGSWWVDGVLYTPWRDGTLKARTFTNGTFGAVSNVALYGSTFASDASNITGAFYDRASSRVYYTMAGSSQLYWRWFTPQSRIIGSVRFAVDGDVSALDPANVRGMFLSGSTLYFANNGSGDLKSVTFSDGQVTGPAQTVDTTQDWSGRTLVLTP
jgi:hypothetical protein